MEVFVREYALPGIFPTEEIQIDQSLLCFDYPDWWYTWNDVDKHMKRMAEADQIIIKSWCENVFKQGSAAYHSWQYRRSWQPVLERFWHNFPEEHIYFPDFWEQCLLSKRELRKLSMKIDKDKAYVPKEVANIFGVTQASIHDLLKSKELRGIKLKRNWRIFGKDILAFINRKANMGEEEVNEQD